MTGGAEFIILSLIAIGSWVAVVLINGEDDDDA